MYTTTPYSRFCSWGLLRVYLLNLLMYLLYLRMRVVRVSVFYVFTYSIRMRVVYSVFTYEGSIYCIYAWGFHYCLNTILRNALSTQWVRFQPRPFHSNGCLFNAIRAPNATQIKHLGPRSPMHGTFLNWSHQSEKLLDYITKFLIHARKLLFRISLRLPFQIIFNFRSNWLQILVNIRSIRYIHDLKIYIYSQPSLIRHTRFLP